MSTSITSVRTDAMASVLPYLRHVSVQRGPSCKCAVDSWAPCGGQYEGRYNPLCPLHRPGSQLVVSHYPSCCPGD